MTSDDVWKRMKGSALPFRNALADWDHVPTDIVLEGADKTQPLVTIAIPTFQRPDLLVEAVRSSLAQKLERPFEVIVMDNDPQSKGAAKLLEQMPELKDRNFRYFVNRENIGMFGNFNRSMRVARGEWLAILNDDDLLDEEFLELMLAVADEVPDADGIACRKRYVDLRRSPASGGRVAVRRAIGRMIRAPLYTWHFGGRSTRRLRPHQFFWGPIAGTPIGFLWRTRCSIDIGGFYPEEFPAADTWFYARFAQRWHLRQHRAIAATSRILENESAKPSTVKRSLESVHRLQRTLAEKDAPRWWLRFAPLVLARLRRSAESSFGTFIPDEEMEEALGLRLGKDRPYLLSVVRLLCDGWHPDPV